MRRLAVLCGALLLGATAARAATQVLGLEQAQAQAVSNNLDIQLTASQIDEADALMLGARSVVLPQVSFSHTGIRTNDPVGAFGMRLRQERFAQADFALPALNRPAAISGFQTSLLVQQPLFAGGGNLAGLQQAGSGQQQARLARAEQLGQLRWQVADAYWGLVLARQSLEALRQSLAAARAHAGAAEARFAQGTAVRAEVLAAQTRVAQLEGDEAAAADHVEGANEALTLLLGLDNQTTLVPADTLAPVAPNLSADQLEASALRDRASLRAAQVQLLATRQAVKQARAGHLPRVDAFARLDLDADTPLGRQGESWTLGGVLSWEVFSGFRTSAALRQARARQDQAHNRLALAGEQVRRQVQGAYRQIQTAQRRLAAATQARQYAAERLRLAQHQYQQGLVAVAELLDAQDQDTQTRLRYLEALRQLHSGLAYLEFAAGRPLNPKTGRTP